MSVEHDYCNVKANVSSLDDSDIISQTPEKIKKKFKLDKNVGKSMVNENPLSAVQDKLDVKRNINFDSSKESQLNGFKVKKVNLISYIYYTHEELLCYSETRMPKNTNVRVIGIFNQHASMCFLLKYQLHGCGVSLRIIIKFEKDCDLPVLEECIEVFGCLDFQNVGSKTFPVVNVCFWKKSIIPREYYETINTHFDDTTYLEVANSMSEFFNEYNETVLKDNISCLESHINDFQQIMDTSADIFD